MHILRQTHISQKIFLYRVSHILYFSLVEMLKNICHLHEHIVRRPVDFPKCPCPRKVARREGEWPFFNDVIIIKSDYVNPLGMDAYAKAWRRIHLGDRKEFQNSLYGIVERYLIKTKYSKHPHVAWVHRDEMNPLADMKYINDVWPMPEPTHNYCII